MEKLSIQDEGYCMKLYDSIFKRRSVRNYSSSILPKDKMDHAKKAKDNSIKLENSIDIQMHFIENGEKFADRISGIIGNYGKIHAPHYIAITSEEKEGRFRGIGYLCEQIVLYLTSLDVGTCWIGKGATDKILSNFVEMPKNHTSTSLIAFGYAEKDKQLKKRNRWKRKNIDDFLLEGNLEELNRPWKRILEAVRVGPSAMNSQPWRFAVEKNILHLHTVKRNKLMNLITGDLENMNKIDGGIALLHSQLAATTLANNAKVFIDRDESRKNLNYIGSLQIEIN